VMRQEMDTDLFPWILGVVLLVAGAFTVALITAQPAPSAPHAALVAPPQDPRIATPPPAPQTAPPEAPALNAQSTATPPQPAAAAPTPESAPASASAQIWQCNVNGQKVFADSPCGTDASVRQLGEVNRMNPTPVLPQSAYSAYQPPYPPYMDQPTDDTQGVPGNTVYVTRPVFLYGAPPRPQRPQHPHRPEPRAAPRHL
jgi:hypothetical protein